MSGIVQGVGFRYAVARAAQSRGVTGWVRGAALAQARGIRVSNHLWPEISAQLLSVTPTAHWLEYADWWNAVVAEPLRLKDGVSCVDNARGTGVEWNEGAIEKLV